MPQFRLVSAADPDHCVEIDGTNAASALDIAVRHAIAEAAVFKDGRYLFTARHGESGIWVISQESPQGHAPPGPCVAGDAGLAQ